jgi:hypothetical protein
MGSLTGRVGHVTIHLSPNFTSLFVDLLFPERLSSVACARCLLGPRLIHWSPDVLPPAPDLSHEAVYRERAEHRHFFLELLSAYLRAEPGQPRRRLARDLWECHATLLFLDYALDHYAEGRGFFAPAPGHYDPPARKKRPRL